MDNVIRKTGDGKLLLYHRTTAPRASAILSEGFRDGAIQYGRDTKFEGVWVSNIPLRPDQGVKGEAVLCICASLIKADLADYEWREERLTHREWFIPARLLNSCGKIALDGNLSNLDTSEQSAAEAFEPAS